MTAVIAFLLIYFVEDCQALGKDPIEHPLQVGVGTVETCIGKGRSRMLTTTNDHACPHTHDHARTTMHDHE